MSETKLGPYGEVIGIDGPEDELFPPPGDENYELVIPQGRTRRWWTATQGIRFVAVVAVVGPAGVLAMALISSR